MTGIGKTQNYSEHATRTFLQKLFTSIFFRILICNNAKIIIKKRKQDSLKSFVNELKLEMLLGKRKWKFLNGNELTLLWWCGGELRVLFFRADTVVDAMWALSCCPTDGFLNIWRGRATACIPIRRFLPSSVPLLKSARNSNRNRPCYKLSFSTTKIKNKL